MNVQLRLFLFLISILFFIFVLKTVHSKKLLLKDSLLWMLMAIMMLLLAIFPQIAIYLSRALGIETPSNFVFFVALIMLFMLVFRQTIALSKQTIQIEKQIQELALTTLDQHKQESECKHD